MKTRTTIALLVAGLCLLLAYNPAAHAEEPPLLDRALFFDDPEVSGGQLSPDGQFLSFMRPYEETRNIWVKPIDAPFDEALPITDRTDRPIMGYFWSRDGKYILFVMDQDGDENFNIYALDPTDASEGVIPEARNITDLEGVRAQISHIARHDHDLMFVGLNERDPSWHDLYSLRISTGALNLLRENNRRYTSWIFDRDDRLRLASRSREDGANELWRMDDDGDETLIYEWSMLETAYPSGFLPGNDAFYLVTNKGADRDKSKLYVMDINTLEKTFVEKDPENRVDFGGLWRSDQTGEVIATIYVDDKRRIYFKDDEVERHYHHMLSELGEDIDISFGSGTTDERLFMVSAYSDTQPASVYIYDMDEMTIRYQYTPREALPSAYMSPMLAISYPSSDGLEIPAYLTMPKGFGETNLPVVVFPHGGPWARDYWGFSTWVQFLANRGYAVLQPNFRGSTGFGKEFLNAGNLEWGDLMQDDITWGVQYLIDQGIADPERIAIFGISYGGYATLAGLAFTANLYAAGVSFVGPSNLITLLNSIPPYWEAMRKTLHKRMGDPSTPEGEAELMRQSPLFSADQIVAPLMVVQGQNDPRVLKAESDQIVVALRDRGFPVTYLNAPDEGHGFARPVNNMAFIAAMEAFLATHAGGRYQKEMPDDVAKRLEEITVDVSTVTLPEGISEEEARSVLTPVRGLPEGRFTYRITLEAMGLDMETVVEIAPMDDMVQITEMSQTPMGEATDVMTLVAATLQPVSRQVNQGQVSIDIAYAPDKVEGMMHIDQQEMPVQVALDGPLFAEGPAQGIQLATLPLSDGYSGIFRNVDMNAMTEKLFRMHTHADQLEDGTPTWRIDLSHADGSPGGQTIWVDQYTYQVLKYEVVVPELDGAIMKGKLVTE